MIGPDHRGTQYDWSRSQINLMSISIMIGMYFLIISDYVLTCESSSIHEIRNLNNIINRTNNSNKNVHDGSESLYELLPGITSDVLKSSLYNMLHEMVDNPIQTMHILMTGEFPGTRKESSMIQKHISNPIQNKKPYQKNIEMLSSITLKVPISRITPKNFKGQSSIFDSEQEISSPSRKEIILKFPRKDDVLSNQLKKSETILPTNKIRRKRSGEGIMYLPINQPQADPCAAPKGSKLLQALPMVFLSTMLSVADAAGNVMNNINNNNRNNNNNNNNNINNDNINLSANINNANQLNILPLGREMLKMARSIMDSLGEVAISVYKTVVPPSSSSKEVHNATTSTFEKTHNSTSSAI